MPISLTSSETAYTQNFDTLSNTAGGTTNSLTLDGWFLTETGGGARDNEQYAVDTGSSNTGDTYSYGSTGAGDRALGQLRSGTLISTFGAELTNDTGATITSLLISYVGEQWRLGTAGRTDQLNFEISFDATSLTSGTWTNISQLNFTTPNTVTTGAKDGNAVANRTALSFDLTGLSIASGATFWIRWVDTDASGADDGLAVDDLSITPTTDAASPGTLDIADASVVEGDSGTSTISFTVTRSNGDAGAVSATWTASFGGSADADDFAVGQLFTGSVDFADGETSMTITLEVQGDVTIEGDETLTVTLSDPTGGAALGDDSATGTITDDDAPRVTIDDVSTAEGDGGATILTFTVTRTGGTGAFDVDFATGGGVATADEDYAAQSGTLSFAESENSKTISITVNGDTASEPSETFEITLSGATNGAIIDDAIGLGTIVNDDLTFIHAIQGTSYFSPILAGDGIGAFNAASTTIVTIRAVVTALDGVGGRQGFYVTEELADWDGNPFTSEGIFVMTRNDSSVGQTLAAAAPGLAVGDIVTVTAQVMEYQTFSNMPRTMLVNASSIVIESGGNAVPTLTITSAPNSIMTGVTPDYFDSSDDANDSFDAANYALSFWETVEGMLVTIPNMVAADGFVLTSGGRPYLQAYSTDLADADQINSRGGYTIGGDPPNSPPDTLDPDDATSQGGRHIHDGDVNPDIIEVDFTDFAIAPPAGLLANVTMGDLLGDLTGIVEFDFTDRKLFVTDIGGTGFVDGGQPVQEVTSFGGDGRSLTIATFNVENLDPGDGAARFAALAAAIKDNLNAPDIICVEEIQDNNGTTNNGTTDASTTWQMLVDALNAATGKAYQWVDEAPANNSDGGATGGNIRVGFLYDTARVQLGDLPDTATLAERRQYTDRIGDGVRDAGDLIAFSDDMLGGEIVTSDWTSTRKSLLGEFTFNGNKVFVVANHWPSKIGSGSFWQLDQDLAAGNPTNSDWAQRNAVAQDVYAMMDLIETGAPDAGIVAGGDFNEFYFNRPLEVLTGYVTTDGAARVGGSRFDNLTVTGLAEAERYTYTFDGRAQAIDHVIANQRLSLVAGYDVVHINTGYNPGSSPALSDHDPAVATFNFRGYGEVLTGTSGAEYINGLGGNDTIRGLDGRDVLAGGEGNDRLLGGADVANELYGGVGDDAFVVENAGDSIVEFADEGTDTVETALAAYVLRAANVENLTGTSASGQQLRGNELGNRIAGGLGNDTLAGGLGDDTYVLLNAGDSIVEALNGGTDTVETALAAYVLRAANVENLTGTSASGQQLRGNDLDNWITGGTGNDTLIGGLGDDTYVVLNAGDSIIEQAGEGNDTVETALSVYFLNAANVENLIYTGTGDFYGAGNDGDNVIIGCAGNDILRGGLGADILVGGLGNDRYLFDTALGGGNIDAIVGFESGSDRIWLEDSIFTQLGVGALPAGAFVIGTQAQDANDRIIYDQDTGALFYDADGDGAGAAVQFASLDPGAALNSGDFAVI